LDLLVFDWINVPMDDLGSSLYPGSTNTGLCSYSTGDGLEIPIKFNTAFSILR
jgi:hypothetical protein